MNGVEVWPELSPVGDDNPRWSSGVTPYRIGLRVTGVQLTPTGAALGVVAPNGLWWVSQDWSEFWSLTRGPWVVNVQLSGVSSPAGGGASVIYNGNTVFVSVESGYAWSHSNIVEAFEPDPCTVGGSAAVVVRPVATDGFGLQGVANIAEDAEDRGLYGLTTKRPSVGQWSTRLARRRDHSRVFIRQEV